MTVRLLLVDDHPVFLDGLAALFAAQDWAEVVALARSGADALQQQGRAGALDVAVVDLQLPDIDGVELTRRLLAAAPALRVLLLTMHAGQDAVLRGLAAGASGYVLKDAEPEDVIASVRQVARGGLVVGAGAASVVRTRIEGDDQRLPADLTPRDRQLLELLAGGLATADIAATLSVSTKTVRNRLSELMAVLGVSSRGDRARAQRRSRPGAPCPAKQIPLT
jgi:DNA-binding NarL/FixJ family response regulator